MSPPETKPENAWIEAYRNGDVEALGHLVEHTRRPLFSFIHRMVRDNHEAEEVFQEVWLRAVKNLHRYQDRNFMSWMFRITHNLVIDRARKKKPDLNLEDPIGSGDDGKTLSWYDRLCADGLGPDRIAASDDLGQRIADAVALLPPEQREVFLLRTEQAMPFKEIAVIQDTSINTSLARMQYALAKLREALAADFIDFRGVENP